MNRNRHILILVLILVCLAGGAFAWRMYSAEREVQLPQPPEVSYAEARPLTSPASLIIPAIRVDTDIQHVGIAASGNMAVPQGYSDVGWYRHGAAPGDKGNAVIAGHLDNGFGLPAVFSRLDELKPGDEITVVDESGDEVVFVVERTAVYPYDAAPEDLDEVFGSADESRLNLITCDGTWNGDTESYSDRLVVFTRALGTPIGEDIP